MRNIVKLEIFSLSCLYIGFHVAFYQLSFQFFCDTDSCFKIEYARNAIREYTGQTNKEKGNYMTFIKKPDIQVLQYSG